jgi:hypothetical protein
MIIHTDWINQDPKKVALAACMRKQLTILNSMMKNGTHWEENLLKVLTGKHSHLPIPTTVLISAEGIAK